MTRITLAACALVAAYAASVAAWRWVRWQHEGRVLRSRAQREVEDVLAGPWAGTEGE